MGWLLTHSFNGRSGRGTSESWAGPCMTRRPCGEHRGQQERGPSRGTAAGLNSDRHQATSAFPQNHKSSWSQPSGLRVQSFHKDTPGSAKSTRLRGHWRAASAACLWKGGWTKWALGRPTAHPAPTVQLEGGGRSGQPNTAPGSAVEARAAARPATDSPASVSTEPAEKPRPNYTFVPLICLVRGQFQLLKLFLKWNLNLSASFSEL